MCRLVGVRGTKVVEESERKSRERSRNGLKSRRDEVFGRVCCEREHVKEKESRSAGAE